MVIIKRENVFFVMERLLLHAFYVRISQTNLFVTKISASLFIGGVKYLKIIVYLGELLPLKHHRIWFHINIWFNTYFGELVNFMVGQVLLGFLAYHLLSRLEKYVNQVI